MPQNTDDFPEKWSQNTALTHPKLNYPTAGYGPAGPKSSPPRRRAFLRKHSADVHPARLQGEFPLTPMPPLAENPAHPRTFLRINQKMAVQNRNSRKECDTPLEINVRDDRKIVEIWLTNEEQQDQGFRESLKPLYQEYKAKKYMIAEFLSGNLDLTEETAALLRYNKRRSAEQEVKRKRSRSMAR